MTSRVNLEKELFTTFEAAKICQVNITSIKNWIEQGKIRAFRTPGGHWRIERAHLVSFLERYGMPNPFIEKSERTVLLVGLEPAACEMVRRAAGRSAHVHATDDLVEAAFVTGDTRPSCIVLDPSHSEGQVLNIVKIIRNDARFTRSLVLAYSDTDDTDFEHSALDAGVSQFIRHSDGIEALQQRVAESLL